VTALFVVADVLDALGAMPDNSVDMALTSPPFFGLRSYLPAGDPNKGHELGSEDTPAEFLQALLEVITELGRVVADHGSIVVELGDTQSGSGGAGGDYNTNGLRDGQPRFRQGRGPGWPRPKSMCAIPGLVQASLAYGRNLLTGASFEPWIVRNHVAWVRANPPVGSLGDKFRPATSFLIVATRSPTRFFDLDAVRVPYSEAMTDFIRRGSRGRTVPGQAAGIGSDWTNSEGGLEARDMGGAPPLDWWHINTVPYAGAHYAAFPPDLCTIPIRSMCPQRVCRTCGQPSRRIVKTERLINGKVADENTPQYAATHVEQRTIRGKNLVKLRPDGVPERATYGRITETIGWTDCHHDNWRPGIVLDPFAGTGTVLAVATGNGRDAIGIDIDKRNLDLAVDRVGPLFLTEATVDQAAHWLDGSEVSP
jgi:DNA modification methylase